jgi:hypothetical protein
MVGMAAAPEEELEEALAEAEPDAEPDEEPSVVLEEEPVAVAVTPEPVIGTGAVPYSEDRLA